MKLTERVKLGILIGMTFVAVNAIFWFTDHSYPNGLQVMIGVVRDIGRAVN